MDNNNLTDLVRQTRFIPSQLRMDDSTDVKKKFITEKLIELSKSGGRFKVSLDDGGHFWNNIQGSIQHNEDAGNFTIRSTGYDDVNFTVEMLRSIRLVLWIFDSGVCLGNGYEKDNTGE